MMIKGELSSEERERIENVLKAVQAEGRSRLYESEVYRILDILGIRIPNFSHITSEDEITDDILEGFPGEHIVLKIVSDEITHKSKVGGVRIVAKEVGLVRRAYAEMMAAVNAHFGPNERPELNGAIAVEKVDYSEALGNELLLGFREDPSFGPVMTVGKGGSDTEFFAREYTPPDIRLVPLPESEVDDMIRESRIYKKYTEKGLESHAEEIKRAIFKLSQLAATYSSFNSERAEYCFTNFEVNPFVFDSDEKLIPIDGVAEIEALDCERKLPKDPDTINLEAFFKPNGIAVVGVSASDPSKMANQIAGLLHSYGRDDLYFVNVKGGELTLGEKSYELFKSISDIPETPELVVDVVPAKLAPELVREAVQCGTKAIILIPGGFSEVKGGKSLEKEIEEIIEGTSTRIIGPNCLGVLYPPAGSVKGLNTVFVPESRLAFIPKEKRNVALLTQSGALGLSQLDKLRYSVYPVAMVSYGNQLDVTASDLVAYFDGDDETGVIALYIEGFKASGGRQFFDVVRQATKPVIVYKAGRTSAGSQAAAFHTASMTGDYAVAEAAFEQAGAIVADNLLDHKDLIKAFSLLLDKKVRGKRIAGVVNAGFESTYAADSLGGFDLAELSDDTRKKLREILPDIVNVSAMLDVTPMSDDKIYVGCSEIFLSDDNVDCLLISMLPYTVRLDATAEHMLQAENTATRLIDLMNRFDKPIVVSISTSPLYAPLIDALESGGIPVYSTAQRAIKSLEGFVDWKLGRARS
jgi:acyl-CoA synthetase (NDP forming)